MAEKALGAALRSPRKQQDQLLEELREEEHAEHGGAIERELRQLIAKHGPDPERIVDLLGDRKPWERRRAGMILAADYGQEAAEFLLRSAANRAIFDTQSPLVERLRRAAAQGRKGHGKLLAQTFRERAQGKGKGRLPQGLREQGQPLPEAVRLGLERTVGESGGDIRVVSGAEAGEAAAAVDAVAVTTDGTILLSDQQYRPDTVEGQALLAHEAVHALQQRGAEGAGLASPAAEAEADRIANQVVAPLPGATAAPEAVQVPVGRQAIARKGPEPVVSASASAQIRLKFTLGPATVDVDLQAQASASANASGQTTASASASAVTTVDLDTAKLNTLLPKGVRFTDPKIKIKVKNNKLAEAIVIKAEYEGKEPYLKKVPFQFKCDTNGTLSAKVALDMQIPGFCKAKSDQLTIQKSGITGDIEIDPAAFTIPGTGAGGKGLAIDGKLVAHIKDNNLDGIDGDASINLPQGFGKAKITAKVAGGKLTEATADLSTGAIPGLGTVTAKLKWSQAGGFELEKLSVPVKQIPGLDGSIDLSFKKGKFAAEAKSLKFKAKALEAIKFENVKISDAGLEGTAKLTGVNLNVPGWLKISGLKGAFTLKGGKVSANDVSANIEVAGGKAKGSLQLSYVDGDLKAKGKVTKLDLAPSILKLGPEGLSFDLDLGGGGVSMGGGGASVVGKIAVKIGKWADGAIDKLGFSNGYFTGVAKIPFKAGVLKGINIDIELLAAAPWVKANINAAGLVGKKLEVPFKGPIPVDVTCTKANLAFSGDLSDLSGNVGGTVKVDGGKLGDGDFDLKAEKGSVEGDLKVNVKTIPGLKTKGPAELKLHVKDTKVTGSGKVSLEFEKFVKGTVDVAYDSAKGFSVAGKGLQVDVPGLPFDIKPFDVTYAEGKLSVKNVVGTLKPGKIPGVKTATIKIDFVDNKLTIELKDVAFSVPQLKKTTLSAKWNDGKWEVKGEAELTLPKGLSAKAKFGANNGAGNELNFNAELEVSVDQLKKVLPGVEITSGKLVVKYQDGKLSLDNVQLGVIIANGVLKGNLGFSMNEDKTFNASGNLALALKFIKAKNIEVKVERNELKRIAVTGLELDLPKGKGSLTGSAALENGKFNCNLQAKVQDLPWVESASATVVIKDGKWEKFEAAGKLKQTPGIDLSKLNIGGKLEGGSPAFFCDGPVPIKGIKEPLQFHLLIGANKFEIGLKGTFEIKGIGTATVGADLSNEGFHADLTVTPTNQKVVKKASAWVDYKNKTLTFGGEVTVTIAKDFEGSVKFEKLADGDFQFKGTVKPTKAKSGESKKKALLGPKKVQPSPFMAPYGIPPLLDVHLSAGVSAEFEAGIYTPSFNFISASVSGKLSELEKGELPDAKIMVQPSMGVYASAGLTAHIGVGASFLGASIDLQGEATGKLEAKAMINAPLMLEKVGNSYKISADLKAELGAVLQLILGIAVVLRFVGKELYRWPLASKTFDLANFKFGEFPLAHWEHTFGDTTKKEPTAAEATPKEPNYDALNKQGGDIAKQKIAEAKDTAIEKIKSSGIYKVGKAIYDGAKRVYDFVTSW